MTLWIFIISYLPEFSKLKQFLDFQYCAEFKIVEPERMLKGQVKFLRLGHCKHVYNIRWLAQ